MEQPKNVIYFLSLLLLRQIYIILSIFNAQDNILYLMIIKILQYEAKRASERVLKVGEIGSIPFLPPFSDLFCSRCLQLVVRGSVVQDPFLFVCLKWTGELPFICKIRWVKRGIVARFVDWQQKSNDAHMQYMNY